MTEGGSKLSGRTSTNGHQVTPDGRYMIVRGRLWRLSNPALSEAYRQTLVDALMTARRGVAAARRAKDEVAEDHAHAAVDQIKQDLGERGPVWWSDGAPDLNRHMVRNTSYAQWFDEHSNDDLNS